MTVEFATFPYQQGDGSTPWLKVDVKGSTEFLTLPGVAFAFASGEKIEQDVGRIIGLQTYQITRYRIPSIDQWLAVAIPASAASTRTPSSSARRPCSRGICSSPPRTSRARPTALGGPMCEGSINLVYRSVKWNQGMRSDGNFDDITRRPTRPATLAAAQLKRRR